MLYICVLLVNVFMVHIRIVGLDLAAKSKNPTGICFLDNSLATTKILKKDDEIIESIIQFSPEIVAIDAPLSFGERSCDKLLKKYGVMPLKLVSIHNLAERAIALVENLKQKSEVNVIEVFPTATAKILGVYSKDLKVKKDLIQQRLEIGISNEMTRDEIDALLCALTGFIFEKGLSIDVGDDFGKITVPDETKVDIIVRMIQNLRLWVKS